MLFKNVASQGVYLFAYDVTNSVAKTGDAANITGKISKDGGAEASTNTANPTEIGHGVYWQPLSQGETNANAVSIAWSSSSSGIQIDPFSALTQAGAVPQVAAGSSGGLPTVDASNGVKVSVGTSTGQINVSSGKVPATMGSTDYSGNTVQTGDSYAIVNSSTFGNAKLVRATVPGTTLDTSSVAQTGDSYARIGTAGVGLTNLGDTRIAHLDADVSSRSTYAGADTSGTTTLLTRLTSTRAGLLDNLDAAVSSRSTYAGADTSGTTTLLSRLSSTRANNLDNLDATVSSRLASASYTSPTGASVVLSAAGLDNIVIESSITASAALTDDSGTQLTSLNARQVLSALGAVLCGQDTGGGTGSISFPPMGKPAGSARVSTSGADSSGNRGTLAIKVPT